jgi:DNA-binding MarR family transcriptional regulator
MLSQVLVAFVIEFDNAFEAKMAKTFARPFGTSMVMWSNFMRFVREQGTPVGELAKASSIPRNAVASVVGGMERWGYIKVDHDPKQGVGAPRKGFGSARGVRAETMIYPSMTGEVAQRIWEPLAAEIEGRWTERLGGPAVEGLRDALAAIHGSLPLALPHFLPIVGGGGLFAHRELEAGPNEPDGDLPALLSRVLLAFTLDHEAESEVSLPIGANVLRVLDDRVTPVKDLPLAAGVSKEAVNMSMTWLEKAGHIVVELHPTARGKIVRTTPAGAEAQSAYTRRLGEVETAWGQRSGPDSVAALRSSLGHILDQPGGEDGPLSAGLVTPPGGWRGKGRYKPLTAAFIESPRGALPHHPMVLHRGGWPDGS